jgi:hypothetical protein
MERRLTLDADAGEEVFMSISTVALAARTILALGASLVVTTTYGEDLPQAGSYAQTSMARGFERSALPLLRRSAAQSAELVGRELVEKVCPTPCEGLTRSSAGISTQMATGRWSLMLSEDGTAARFENLEVSQKSHSMARSYQQAASVPELIEAGRRVISSELASVIALGSDEEIVPLRTDRRVEGGLNVATGTTDRSVVANRVVFGRTIRGVPVVGGGSTVVMTFANDGALESFRYDWPRYETTEVRSVVSIEDVLGRLLKIISLRRGVPSNSYARPSQGQGAAGTISLGNNATLQKLECGYYDPGVVARSPGTVVQPGCVYHVVATSEDGTRAAFAGAVPGAMQIELDGSWTEATMLRGPQPGAPALAPPSAHYP